MRSGPHLEIELDRPELLVRGTFDEATPALLSGRLVVNLSETIRVRSLRLVFTGRVDTSVSQAVSTVRADQDEHREILSHTWTFLSHKHSEQLSGRSVYPFELLVSGDNPETIHTVLGKVRYELHATLERSGLHTNTSAHKEVMVKRGPVAGAPWALALMESIEAVGTWDGQLEYRVTVPTRSLTDNELFHTRFELQPRSKGLTLVAVGVLIKEYTRYYNSRMQPVHKFSRVVARNENYVTQSGACSVDALKPSQCMSLVDATSIHVPLAVPAAYTHIQYDVSTELVEVRHRIKFLIKVRDSRMLVHSVFVAVPVCVQPVSARDEASILPRYEGAGGVVIMRSDTLPPAYGDVDGLGVGMGEDVDGFPGALRHSRSQFYLASPDHSPRMNAARDGSETLQSSETLQESSEMLTDMKINSVFVGLAIVAVGVSGLPVPVNHSLRVNKETWISPGTLWNSFLSGITTPGTVSVVAKPKRSTHAHARDSIFDLLPEEVRDKVGTIVPQLQNLIPSDTWSKILNALDQVSNIDVQSLVDLVPADVKDKLQGLNISVDEVIAMVPETIRDKVPDLESIITLFVSYLQDETSGPVSANETNFPFELFNFNQ
ncbi:hypothetical protein GGH19_004653 [Coemansia sp. RSA 1807]|nr:hypothetical protein GGH19_004653 [Coemansia sp. RSA 1807]